MYAKTCFVTLSPWIWRSSFGSSFFTGSPFHPVRTHKRLVPTSGEHQKETAFISCNWPPSSHKIGASISPHDSHPIRCTLARMNPIPYTEKRLFTIRSSDRFWGAVWSDHRTGIDTPKRCLEGSHEDVELQRKLWLSGCVPYHFVYHCLPQWGSSMASKLSLLVSMERHLTTKTWDHGNRHICDISRSSSVALCVLWWRSGFTVFWHYWWLLRDLPQCRGSRSVAPTADGSEKQVPSGIKGHASCKAQLIWHLSCCMSCPLLLFLLSFLA